MGVGVGAAFRMPQPVGVAGQIPVGARNSGSAEVATQRSFHLLADRIEAKEDA